MGSVHLARRRPRFDSWSAHPPPPSAMGTADPIVPMPANIVFKCVLQVDCLVVVSSRDRVRVLYRRPDTTMVSPGSAKTRQQSWRPPPSSWKTVHEGSSSDKLSLPIAKTNQMPCLELQVIILSIGLTIHYHI